MAGQNNIQFFKDFLSNESNRSLITLLRVSMETLRFGLYRSNVFFVRLKSANCNSFVSFSKATLDAEVQRNEKSFPIIAPFMVFFLRGLEVLMKFLDRTDPTVPDNISEQQALKDLLNFLTNTSDQSAFIAENKEKGKAELEALAERIAQHLLVPLAPHKTFVIDSYPGLKLEECCGVQHDVNGNKGDTSFGCLKGWHGRADILLMGEKIPFTVVETPRDYGDPETVSVSSDSSVEVKKGDNSNFSHESITQVTAKTIVYSFIQRKKNPNSPNSLVPAFGICSKKLIINLYDCVEDILITTGPIDLFARMICSDWNLSTVIMLWLALNHGIFGNKTPEKYKGYTSNLHNLLGPLLLDAYYNESDLPFKPKFDEQLDSQRYMDDLNTDTFDGRDDAVEFITEKMHKSVSLK